MEYVVLQVVLKEELIGTGSSNLGQLEAVINSQARKGYRLHTISTTSSGSKGLLGGDRIQATLVFEKLTNNLLANNKEELLKYQKLVGMGAITEEEFEEQKNKLLNN